jgi:primase-polymerase (primpol)-like protein
VGKEEERAKEDPREAVRRERRAKEARELLAKQEAEEQGLDYDRVKAMAKNIEQVDWEVRTKEKRQRNANIGFASTSMRCSVCVGTTVYLCLYALCLCPRAPGPQC